MTAAAVLKVRFDDLSIMARTVYGEARCEPPEGKLAVAHVILNRVQSAARWGSSIGEVCLERWQFSCWNPGDRNRELLSRLGLDDAALLACTKICLEALSGIPDPTSGATRYHRVNLVELPAWVRGRAPDLVIGRHAFYRNDGHDRGPGRAAARFVARGPAERRATAGFASR